LIQTTCERVDQRVASWQERGQRVTRFACGDRKTYEPFGISFWSLAFCSASRSPCSFFFGGVFRFSGFSDWLPVSPPNPLLSSFGSHRNSRMLSMQATGVLLMALLCACGPAGVRGQLTYAQVCTTDVSYAFCCCKRLTAVPTGIPTRTTGL
jgi:hypothetical protein